MGQNNLQINYPEVFSMCEIFKALQQAMKLVHQAKNDEQLKARLALVGLLSTEFSMSVKERILQFDYPNEIKEKLSNLSQEESNV